MATTPLDPGVGYGIVLGLGFAFALGMVSCISARIELLLVNFYDWHAHKSFWRGRRPSLGLNGEERPVFTTRGSTR